MFIGYKQTDRQTDKQSIYIDVCYSMHFEYIFVVFMSVFAFIVFVYVVNICLQLKYILHIENFVRKTTMYPTGTPTTSI